MIGMRVGGRRVMGGGLEGDYVKGGDMVILHEVVVWWI